MLKNILILILTATFTFWLLEGLRIHTPMMRLRGSGFLQVKGKC